MLRSSAKRELVPVAQTRHARIHSAVGDDDDDDDDDG